MPHLTGASALPCKTGKEVIQYVPISLISVVTYSGEPA